MTRWIKGSVGSRRFGVLFLLATLAAGALLVTASAPENRRDGPDRVAAPLGQGKLLLQGGSMFIPATAHVAGSAGTNWRTDAEVFNFSQQMAQYQIALLIKDQNNSNPATVNFNLSPGQSIRYNDVLQSIFGFSGSAALWITVQAGEVIVSSRTYNQVPGGTYGQYIGGVFDAQAIQFGQEGRIIQLTHNRASNDGFRTNAGFLNCTSMSIAVQVRMYSWDGTQIGIRTYNLGPYTYTQIDRIFEQVTQSDVSDGYLIVETLTPGGKLFAYASVVDNRTGDPIYIPAVLIVGEAPSPTPTPTSPPPTSTPTWTPTGVPPTATPTYTPTQGGANANLRPFQPSGWDAPVVASGVPGTSVSGGLVGGQTTYVDWAVINEGPADVVFQAGEVIAQMDLDGVPSVAWSNSSQFVLQSGFYVFVEDYEWEGIGAGQHTLRLIGDPDGLIPETNEGDNSWDFNGTWSAGKSTHKPPKETVVIDASRLRTAPVPGFGSAMAWGRSRDEIAMKRRLAKEAGDRPGTLRRVKSFAEPVYIPAAAHVAGAAGTNWRTDLELHNPGTAPAQYEIALLRRDQANPQPVTVIYTVAPGRCLRLNDVLFSIFGLDGGAALRITPLSGTVIVTSRTFNLVSVGTYGQFIGGAPLSQAIQHGQTAALIQLTQNSDFRANLGFVSATGSPITVRADMYRSDGSFLGTRNYQLSAFMHGQIDRIFQQVTGSDVSDGYIVVSTTTPGGRFFAYASVVDNASGDPVYIPAIIIGGAAGPTPTPTPTSPGPTSTPTPTPTSPGPTTTPTPTPTVGPGVPLDPFFAVDTIMQWLGTLGQGGNISLEEFAGQLHTIGLQGFLDTVPALLPGVVTVGTNSLDFDFPPGYMSPDGVPVSGTASVDWTNVNTTAPNLQWDFSGTAQDIQIDGNNLSIENASGAVDLMTDSQGHVTGTINFSGSGGSPKSTKSISTVTGNPELNTEICPNYPIAGQVVVQREEGRHEFNWDDGCDGTFVYVGPGGTGRLAFRLRWPGPQDLDLYVEDPFGEVIYFGNRDSASGGHLDVDANAGCSGPSPDPTENIFWEDEAPSGTYTYWGDLWSACSASSTPDVTLLVIVNGVIHRVIETAIANGETQHYTHQHPPVPTPTPTPTPTPMAFAGQDPCATGGCVGPNGPVLVDINENGMPDPGIDLGITAHRGPNGITINSPWQCDLLDYENVIQFAATDKKRRVIALERASRSGIVQRVEIDPAAFAKGRPTRGFIEQTRPGRPTISGTAELRDIDGDGFFERAIGKETTGRGFSFELMFIGADVDGDELPDYVSIPWAEANLVGVRVGDGCGPIASTTDEPQVWVPLVDTDGDGARDSVVADLDGDFKADDFIFWSPPLAMMAAPGVAYVPGRPAPHRVPSLSKMGLGVLLLGASFGGWLTLRRRGALG